MADYYMVTRPKQTRQHSLINNIVLRKWMFGLVLSFHSVHIKGAFLIQQTTSRYTSWLVWENTGVFHLSFAKDHITVPWSKLPIVLDDEVV